MIYRLFAKKGFSKMAAAIGCLGFAFAPPPAIATAELYENLDVHGVLECFVDGDIRLAATEKRPLDCEYEAIATPGEFKKFHATVRKLDTVLAFNENEPIKWTVLYLKRDDETADPDASMEGRYARAWAHITDEYELKDNTLVGGEKNVFALEPRADEKGKRSEIAKSILYLELTR